MGLFTIGGGLVVLVLLENEVITHGWMTKTEFANMVAISQSTPGAIGVNLATYTGYIQAGIPGSIISTVGLVTPSLLIIILIARYFHAFSKNVYVKRSFVALRPAVAGLIAAAAFSIAETSFIPSAIKLTKLPAFFTDIKTIIFICAVFVVFLVDVHPIFFILIGALAGILFL